MASKRAQRRHGCRGKKVYADLAQARHDARVLGRREGKTLDAYRCRHCGRVHVGHHPWHGGGAPATV
jgi:hypothetical protein